MPRLHIQDLARRCGTALNEKIIIPDHDGLVSLITLLMGVYHNSYPDKELGREIAMLIIRSENRVARSQN